MRIGEKLNLDCSDIILQSFLLHLNSKIIVRIEGNYFVF